MEYHQQHHYHINLCVRQPYGEKIAVGYCSFVVACTPLYLLDMFAPLL